LRRRRDAVEDADLIELRLDSVADPDVPGALQGRRRPVIVTCRPRWEGGHFGGSEDERRRLLHEAVGAGAEYVDLEWQARFDDVLARTNGRGIVLSSHDFDGVPDDLCDRFRAMRATGAEIVKLAVTANRLSDCLPLLAVADVAGEKGNVVLVAMGERGLASRVLAARFGSTWTYAGAMAEVGQIGATALLEGFGLRRLTRSTEVFGVVGSPVSHSVSPAMHNAAFREAGFDGVYLPLAAADASDFVTFGRALDLRGASVTIPFKVALCDHVEEVLPLARRIGAINTIRSLDGRWIGGNTDVEGFLQPLRARGISLAGTRVTLLGAGGSARAVAVAAASDGAELCVSARQPSSAEAVARLVGGRVGTWPPETGSWDLLVNCTPIGMRPEVGKTPVAAAALTGSIVYDLVYNPADTQLLRDAAAAGCRTIGGLEMLVAQAQEQFEWWTGRPPAAGVMQAAAVERLSEFEPNDDYVV
jgi:3-dehydroquinate dehydratase/shikimate dehydrogenase